MVPVIRAAFETACAFPMEDRTLVETFLGSAAVSYGMKWPRVIGNDICKPVINFHRWVQSGLDLEGISLENTPENYYQLREEFNQITFRDGKGDSKEAAARFYFMNKTGYNGLVRFSDPSGRGIGFNVPKGSIKSPCIFTDFSPWQEAMAGWELVSVDFESLEIPPDAVLFMDPPYDSAPAECEEAQIPLFDPLSIDSIDCLSANEGNAFVGYSGDDFSWNDQLRVVRFALSTPNPVVITNRATGRILDLYTKYGFEIETHMVRRNISQSGDRRKPVEEVIAVKREKRN